MLFAQISRPMVWGLMGYLIVIHLVVFLLIKALGKTRQQLKDKERQQD